MLRDALLHYGASPNTTPFIGDQADDLKAAFHAGCRRVLVKTGLGAKAFAAGLPQHLEPLVVYEDLFTAALQIVQHSF